MSPCMSLRPRSKRNESPEHEGPPGLWQGGSGGGTQAGLDAGHGVGGAAPVWGGDSPAVTDRVCCPLPTSGSAVQGQLSGWVSCRSRRPLCPSLGPGLAEGLSPMKMPVRGQLNVRPQELSQEWLARALTQ